MNGMRTLVRPLLAPALTLIMALVLTACGSISDTAVSRSTGLDCTLADLLGEKNAARLLAEEIKCKSAAAPNYPAKVYCYRTLGGVDCYREPNPDGGRTMRPEGVAATSLKAEPVPTRPAAGEGAAKEEAKAAKAATPRPTKAAKAAAPRPAKAAKPPAGGGAKGSAAKRQPEKATKARARRLPAHKPKRPPAASDGDEGNDAASGAAAKPG